MTATLGVGLATAAAVLLFRPPGRWVLRVRLGRTSNPSRLRVPSGALIAPAAVLVAAVAVATSKVPMVIVGSTLTGVTVFVLRQARVARARTVTAAVRGDTIAALDLLAAELRAGVLPAAALTALGEELPLLRPAAVAASAGGDVVEALRLASERPGAAALADLAAAWQVADRAGAPLAAVLDRVATAARDDAEADREVAAEAAPARATGRLMAVLPVLGLGLGAGMGADPVQVITGTLLGALCLAAGVVLAGAGVVWVDRIVASAGAP